MGYFAFNTDNVLFFQLKKNAKNELRFFIFWKTPKHLRVIGVLSKKCGF